MPLKKILLEDKNFIKKLISLAFLFFIILVADLKASSEINIQDCIEVRFRSPAHLKQIVEDASSVYNETYYNNKILFIKDSSVKEGEEIKIPCGSSITDCSMDQNSYFTDVNDVESYSFAISLRVQGYALANTLTKFSKFDHSDSSSFYRSYFINAYNLDENTVKILKPEEKHQVLKPVSFDPPSKSELLICAAHDKEELEKLQSQFPYFHKSILFIDKNTFKSIFFENYQNIRLGTRLLEDIVYHPCYTIFLPFSLPCLVIAEYLGGAALHKLLREPR